MSLLIRVPRTSVIGTKRTPWESNDAAYLAGDRRAYVSRKRAALKIAIRSKGCDV